MATLQLIVPTDDVPRYRQRRDVPRDLRPQTELAERGYLRLGPVRAVLEVGGDALPLYSTSEARVRRDALWASSGAHSRDHSHAPDLVDAIVDGRAAPPGRPRSGQCNGCSETRTGLIDGLCPDCRRRSRQRSLRGAAEGFLTQLFDDDFVVLDTETTGLGRGDEIIELGVIAADGSTLLQTLVFPRSGSVPSAATRVHGLTVADLQGAPTWPEVLPELRGYLAGRRVLAWNAPFDERLARQTSRLWRVRHELPAFECAMRAYALARGVTSGRRRLEAAAAEQGLLDSPQAHRSADDARLTLAVLRRLIDSGS